MLSGWRCLSSRLWKQRRIVVGTCRRGRSSWRSLKIRGWSFLKCKCCCLRHSWDHPPRKLREGLSLCRSCCWGSWKRGRSFKILQSTQSKARRACSSSRHLCSNQGHLPALASNCRLNYKSWTEHRAQQSSCLSRQGKQLTSTDSSSWWLFHSCSRWVLSQGSLTRRWS